MSQTRKLYTHQRFAFMTLDPVHIGTGGYRLGRVDNTIVREPGTNLPKIPGTSLMGAARSYSAMYYGKPEAAGQHKKLKKDQKIYKRSFANSRFSNYTAHFTSWDFNVKILK